MNPSVYLLPQHCSADRRRARAATLAFEQSRLLFARDTVKGDDFGRPFRTLPGCAAKLPRDHDFSSSKKASLLIAKLRASVNAKVVRAVAWFPGAGAEAGYHRQFRLVSGPDDTSARWRYDREFARQRLCGVNPMAIRLCDGMPKAARDAANAYLTHVHPKESRVEALTAARRVFVCEYPELASPRVQKLVARHAHLTAPSAWFWLDESRRLMPLAIQLHPVGEGAPDPVFTPADPAFTWLAARTHVQSADAHLHEGFYHLVETHLVNEAIAVAAFRQLHPDHPLRQLLDPHFDGNLAINDTARGHLLAPTGPIQKAMAAGVAGVLDAARMRFHDWSWHARSLESDLAARGAEHLTDYYYRDDATDLHKAIHTFVAAVLTPWYRGARDVTEDTELTAWLDEIGDPARGNVPGFPTPAEVNTPAALFRLIAEIVFRLGPQHAAVNNGQFDTYGWVPNTPGTFRLAPPASNAEVKEKDFWRALPLPVESLAQMGMVWVLSAPTHGSILQSGNAAAFASEVCFEAAEAVAAFRRRLQAISDKVDARNAALDVPYRYLDPLNVSRSTDI